MAVKLKNLKTQQLDTTQINLPEAKGNVASAVINLEANKAVFGNSKSEFFPTEAVNVKMTVTLNYSNGSVSIKHLSADGKDLPVVEEANTAVSARKTAKETIAAKEAEEVMNQATSQQLELKEKEAQAKREADKLAAEKKKKEEQEAEAKRKADQMAKAIEESNQRMANLQEMAVNVSEIGESVQNLAPKVKTQPAALRKELREAIVKFEDAQVEFEFGLEDLNEAMRSDSPDEYVLCSETQYNNLIGVYNSWNKARHQVSILIKKMKGGDDESGNLELAPVTPTPTTPAPAMKAAKPNPVDKAVEESMSSTKVEDLTGNSISKLSTDDSDCYLDNLNFIMKDIAGYPATKDFPEEIKEFVVSIKADFARIAKENTSFKQVIIDTVDQIKARHNEQIKNINTARVNGNRRKMNLEMPPKEHCVASDLYKDLTKQTKVFRRSGFDANLAFTLLYSASKIDNYLK